MNYEILPIPQGDELLAETIGLPGRLLYLSPTKGLTRDVLGVLQDLSEPLPWLASHQRWLAQDNECLSRMARLEVMAGRYCGGPEMEETDRRRTRRLLSEHLAVYHEALPFSEGERRWLTEKWLDPNLAASSPTRGFRARRDAIGVMEEEVISGGLRCVINGEDVMRRWRSWRREFDEFEGQGTLEIARQALQETIKVVITDPKEAEEVLADVEEYRWL